MDADRRDLIHGLAAGLSLAMLAPATPVSAQPTGRLADQPFARFDSKDKPVRGGTLRLAAPLYVGLLNPNRWPVNDWVNLGHIHQKLMVTDGQYRPTVPYVAESIVRDTPTSAVITLREGVQFHDGTVLDAEALKQTLEWIRTPANATWTTGWLVNLEALEVVAPLKLRARFKDGWASFEGVMANVPGYALSPTALRKDPKRFETVDPKGVGAYTVEEANSGNYLKLRRNPNWWMAKALSRPDMPYFDGILVSVIPDPAVRLASFRAGKLDILNLEKSQYAVLRDDKRFDVYRSPLPITAGYRMNAVKGPCADVRVRKAIRHAIDVKALIEGTQHGVGRIASGLYPGDHWAHNPTLKPADFNPQLARWLLSQAGLEKGVTLKGYITNVTTTVQVAEAVKNMLAQVGINWQVDALSPTAVDARRKSLDWDLAGGGWTWIYDPDLPMTGLYHPQGNFVDGRTNIPDRTEQIEAARREVNLDKRRAMYQELEKRVNDECLDVWLWWEESVSAYQKWVRGYVHKGALEHKEAWVATHPLWFADGKPGKVG